MAFHSHYLAHEFPWRLERAASTGSGHLQSFPETGDGNSEVSEAEEGMSSGFFHLKDFLVALES